MREHLRRVARFERESLPFQRIDLALHRRPHARPGDRLAVGAEDDLDAEPLELGRDAGREWA